MLKSGSIDIVLKFFELFVSLALWMEVIFAILMFSSTDPVNNDKLHKQTSLKLFLNLLTLSVEKSLQLIVLISSPFLKLN